MTVVSGWLGQKEAGEESLFMLFAGPVSLFATLSLALQMGGNLDLAIAAAVGLILSFSLRMRGLFYSLALLGLGALAKHLFFLDAHLWQMGIETSMALGFVICTLSSEQLHAREGTALLKIESQKSALSRLVEEASQSEREAALEKAALQGRLDGLQREFDLLQEEISTLRILNDVVRKSSLKQEEGDARLVEKEKRIGELLREIEAIHLSRPSSEKEELLQELNAARVEREQTCLINETLVRLHAAADRKARELIARNELLEKQFLALSQTQSEKEELARAELQEARIELANLVDYRSSALESERRQWREQLSEQDRTIALFQERIRALSETQSLYFQLKKQFEEKNRVLHETRQELFRAETALEAARIEEQWEEVEFPLFESMLASEVALLEEERRSLETENAELSQIIGLLSKQPKKASKKKKSMRRKSI